jgi:hypothetical protein
LPTIRSASSASGPFICDFYESIGGTRAETFQRVVRFTQVD